MEDGSNGKIEIEETDGSSSGQKGCDLFVPCHGGLWFLRLRKISLFWPRSIGQKEFGRENGNQEQRESWMKQVREVQTWRQARGLAGAVMCETRDLGIKWPQRHTLIFEGDRSIGMRYVCPKDVKNMFLQQATTVYWKKWAAKHEYEELKEGSCLEPALALMRKKAKEDRNEKHRIVARMFFLEGGWVQKRLFDIGWSDEK